MKALFLISNLEVGGSQQKLVRITRQLAARGHSIGVAVLGEPTTLRSELSAEVRFSFLRRAGRISPGALRRLVRLMTIDKPDVVFAVDLYALLYAFIASRIVGRRPKCVALINTTKFVRRRDRLFMTIYAPILRHVDLLVFGCRRQARDWLDVYGLPSDRAVIIYNGVDTSYFDPHSFSASRGEIRHALRIPEGAVVVGTVGRLAPEKNQLCLLDAIWALKRRGVDVSLVLVGDGPLRPVIERRRQELGLAECVHLVGAMRDVRQVLMAMDIFVLPSSSVETFSNAALEAMSMGIPVVMSDIGGAQEMVRDGTDGFIFNHLNSAALVQRLQSLCVSANTRTQMGNSARTRVQQVFDLECMVNAYETILIPQNSSNSQNASDSALGRRGS